MEMTQQVMIVLPVYKLHTRLDMKSQGTQWNTVSILSDSFDRAGLLPGIRDTDKLLGGQKR